MINKSLYLFALTSLLTGILLPSTLAQGRLDRPAFFRDGQEQMEREIQRLQQQPSTPPTQVIEHPSQLLTIDDGQLRWQKYLFQQGGFSVWMPQGLQSEDEVTLNTSVGQLSFEVFASHPTVAKLPKSRFIAAYSEPLNARQLTDEDSLLDSVKEGILEETNSTLVSSKTMKWSNYEGLELVVEENNELIVFRVFFIKDKVYVLAVGQKEQQTLLEEATSFFDSFRLLK
ncbi:MAG: hypothetical protein AB4058_02630 [Microcystaceae cyanobacterium]